MTTFADFRDPIFNSGDPIRVPKTPCKTLDYVQQCIMTDSVTGTDEH